MATNLYKSKKTYIEGHPVMLADGDECEEGDPTDEVTCGKFVAGNVSPIGTYYFDWEAGVTEKSVPEIKLTGSGTAFLIHLIFVYPTPDTDKTVYDYQVTDVTLSIDGREYKLDKHVSPGQQGIDKDPMYSEADTSTWWLTSKPTVSPTNTGITFKRNLAPSTATPCGFCIYDVNECTGIIPCEEDVIPDDPTQECDSAASGMKSLIPRFPMPTKGYIEWNEITGLRYGFDVEVQNSPYEDTTFSWRVIPHPNPPDNNPVVTPTEDFFNNVANLPECVLGGTETIRKEDLKKQLYSCYTGSAYVGSICPLSDLLETIEYEWFTVETTWTDAKGNPSVATGPPIKLINVSTGPGGGLSVRFDHTPENYQNYLEINEGGNYYYTVVFQNAVVGSKIYWTIDAPDTTFGYAPRPISQDDFVTAWGEGVVTQLLNPPPNSSDDLNNINARINIGPISPKNDGVSEITWSRFRIVLHYDAAKTQFAARTGNIQLNYG